MMTRRVFGRLLSLGGMLGLTKGIKALPAADIERNLSFGDKDGLLFRVHAEERDFEIYVNGRVKGFRGESVGIHNLFFRRAGEYHDLWTRNPSKEDLREQALTKEKLIAEYELDNGIEWVERTCNFRFDDEGRCFAVKLESSPMWFPEDMFQEWQKQEDRMRERYRNASPCGQKFRYVKGAVPLCPKCKVIMTYEEFEAVEGIQC